MPGHNILYVGRNRSFAAYGSAFTSPFLLEILSTRTGAPAFVSATGSLTANTGQAVSCSRASSAYCLNNSGLLVLLGANTVRVEPTGLLVEGASTNTVPFSQALQSWAATGVTVTGNTTDVTAPDGTNTATKIVAPLTSGGNPNAYVSIGSGGRTATTYTQSAWMRGASGGEVLYLQDYDGSVLHSKLVTLTTSWQRFTFTYVSGATGAATTAIGVQVGFGTPDFETGQAAATYYVWGAQIENLPFATSYIPTGAASATRDADIVTVANPLNPSNPTFFRAGGTATPLAGATWTQIFNVQSQLWWFNVGQFITAPNWWRLLTGNAGGGHMQALASDATGTTAQWDANNFPFPGGGTGTTAVQAEGQWRANGTQGVSSSGTATTGAQSGAGTGLITSQWPTINFFSVMYGHCTDIYVDNK